MSQYWVFGYGSLIWRPGFAYTEKYDARLRGCHRRLCVYSHFHRGTPDRPGLVLGLDRGGSCRGVAFRICPDAWPETVAYLRAREQVTMVYCETLRPVELMKATGTTTVTALTYVVDRCHEQYAGPLPVEAQISLILQGHGRSGSCHDYVFNTVRHLREMGIRDNRLEAVYAAVASLSGASA